MTNVKGSPEEGPLGPFVIVHQDEQGLEYFLAFKISRCKIKASSTFAASSRRQAIATPQNVQTLAGKTLVLTFVDLVMLEDPCSLASCLLWTARNSTTGFKSCSCCTGQRHKVMQRSSEPDTTVAGQCRKYFSPHNLFQEGWAERTAQGRVAPLLCNEPAPLQLVPTTEATATGLCRMEPAHMLLTSSVTEHCPARR